MGEGQEGASVHPRTVPKGVEKPPPPPEDESKIPVGRRPPPRDTSFTTFLWNPKDRTFFGRTGESWAKITVFYVFFYLFLAGYFAFMMTVFYTTLDDKVPKYTATTGSILQNPGLTAHRHYSDFVRELDVSYNQKNPKANQVKCDKKGPPPGATCIFDISSLGPCSSADEGDYMAGKQCVILKMNKIFNWMPSLITSTNSEIPQGLRDRIKNLEAAGNRTNYVWVWCESKTPNLQFNYYPEAGFSEAFFPYRNQPGYHAPLVAVQFTGVPGSTVTAECNLWAENVKRNAEGNYKRRLGSVEIILELPSEREF